MLAIPARWAGPGSSRQEPTGAPQERVSALKGDDPLSGSRRRLHGAPEAIYADVRGLPLPWPHMSRADDVHRWQPSAVESCARRMMRALWACVLIAPFAVSQCLGVPDPSDGVGVKGELPAELAMLLFV